MGEDWNKYPREHVHAAAQEYAKDWAMRGDGDMFGDPTFEAILMWSRDEIVILERRGVVVA